jgi:ankyrin repeat protein
VLATFVNPIRRFALILFAILFLSGCIIIAPGGRGDLCKCPCAAQRNSTSNDNAAASGPSLQLLDAARNGESDKARKLIDEGAAPNAKDAQGRTPLHLAAANGHQQTSDVLLQCGANINALDKSGKTPLDLAVEGGHDGTAGFLASKGGKRGGDK